MKRKAFALFLLELFIATFFYTCKKDDPNSVPVTPVNIYIYTSDPSFVNLYAVGGWTYVAGGVKGILVYHKSTSEFMAYDRNCTYLPTSNCATVYVDNTNIIATDTCCGSEFSIIDGSVLHAPASIPLKTYQTSYDGTVLHIYN